MRPNILSVLALAIAQSPAVSVLLTGDPSIKWSTSGWYTLQRVDDCWQITPMFGTEKKAVYISEKGLITRMLTYTSLGLQCDVSTEPIIQPLYNNVETNIEFHQPWLVAA